MGAVKQKAQAYIGVQPQREVRVIHHPYQQPENAKLPVAAYVRVSTDMDDQLNSFAAQLRHYKVRIARNDDLELVDVYADEGITGTSTRKRDEFQRLMRDCRKGKIKRVLVKSISRFARNTKDCLEAVRELTSLGVSVLFEKEGIDTDKMSNELFLAAMSDFAQNESLSMAGNLRRGIRMRMEQGTYIPTSTPFGYRWDNGRMVVQPKEAETVRWIFERYLSGIAADRIALELDNREVCGKKGNARWTKSSVRYILGNERYVGDMLHQKSYTSDTLPFTKIHNHGQMDRYLVEDCHVPIIDRATYEKVQLLIEMRRSRAGKGSRDGHAFGGKIFCGACGTLYRVKAVRTVRYWTCRRHDRNTELCASPRIPEAELERAFIRCYNRLRLHNSQITGVMIEQLYSLRRAIGFNNPEAVRLNDAILALVEQNAVFAELAARGIWDAATFQDKKALNDQEIQRLHAQKSLLADNDALDVAIDWSRHIQAVIQEGPPRLEDFHAELFEALVKKIVVAGPGALEICLANGLDLPESYEKAVR